MLSSFLHSLPTYLQQFPQLADPWVTFLLKIAGVVAILGVPVSNIVLEWRKQRAADALARAERERAANEKPKMPANIASPIMSAFSDGMTIDHLRQDMMTLNGNVLVCTNVAGALLLAIEALAAQGTAGAGQGAPMDAAAEPKGSPAG